MYVTLGTHWTGGWMGPTGVVVVVVTREFRVPAWNLMCYGACSKWP